MKFYKLNWHPDLPDHRDFKYKLHPEFKAIKLPETPNIVDLEAAQSRVRSQGQIGSCTGQGWSGLIEALQIKILKDGVGTENAPEIFTPKSFTPVSPMFIYWNERALQGTTAQDSGAQIRTGMKAVQQWGICPESVWPYLAQNEFVQPPKNAYAMGAVHKILYGYKIDNSKEGEIEACLAHGYPIVYGQIVCGSFMSSQVEKSGVIPMPSKSEQVLGGHCTLLVGYNRVTRMFKLKNSWGVEWGQKGYAWIPYDYITNLDMASDFWTARHTFVEQI